MNPFITAVTILIGLIITRNFVAYMASKYSYQSFWIHLNEVLQTEKFGSMAIGAIGAIRLKEVKKYDNIFFNPILQFFCWLLFVLSICFKLYIPYVHSEAMACLYLYLILNVTTCSNPLISLRQGFFEKTGAVSYGLYMYHWPIIPLLIILLRKAGLFSFFTSYYQIPFVSLVYVLTYFIAFVSFKYLETPILKLKPIKYPKKSVEQEAQSFSL